MPEHEVDAAEGAARRDFLKKAGIAGAMAWTAPVLLSHAAGAQGTPLCFPNPVTNNQQRQENTAGGSSVTVNPPGLLTAQIAVAMVPLNTATAATTVNVSGGGGAWTPLVVKQISPLVGVDGDHLAMWVWGRVGSLSNTITFTLAGDAAAPWRGAAFEYLNVTGFGTAAAQGVANTPIATAPAVDIPANSNGSVLWVVATRTDLGPDGFLPPTGYAAAALQFQDTPELCSGHLNSQSGFVTVPAASATMPASADIVGAHVPVLCQY